MVKREYITYKLIPDVNIKNNQNISIIQSMASTFLKPIERVSSKGIIEPMKFYFDIELTKDSANFYLTVPTNVEEMVINKAKTVWNKANIHVEALENNFNIQTTELAELVLKDYTFKSLNTDKGDLFPLTNLLSMTKALNEKERVRVSICLEPLKRTNWIDKAQAEYKDFKKGKKMDRTVKLSEQLTKWGFQGMEKGLEMYINLQLLKFEVLFGVMFPEQAEETKQEILVNIQQSSSDNALTLDGLNHQSTYKRTSEAFLSRILILSDGDNAERTKMNLLATANAYKDLNADNELVMRLPNRKYIKEILKHNFDGSYELVVSDREAAKLIQLPQITLQKLYNLENIETREVMPPKEALTGKIRVGEVALNSKNKTVTVYFSDNVKKVSFTNVVMGAEGCGKTTQIKRIAKECSWQGYSNILIDFIEDNKLAKEVMEGIDVDKTVILRIGDKGFIPALAYNEVSKLITEDLDNWMKIHYASMIAEQVEYLVNSITTTNTGELTDPMVRLLNAACRITFVRPGATLGDVFDTLLRHDKRQQAINYAKSIYSDDSSLFYELKSIDEYSKDGKKVVGTKTTNKSLEGIMSRFTQLTKVPFLEAMLKADIDPSHDFDKWIQEGKSIFVMIPQNLFPNPKTRDIITTYFMTRIWLTAQIREDNTNSRLCNLIFDEVHQMPNTASFIAEHVNEFRRHRLGLTISCHYLGQFKSLEEAMLSKRTNYIICQSTQKDNVKKLAEEIQPFTLDDLANLKLHEAICSINYPSGRHNFICKLSK